MAKLFTPENRQVTMERICALLKDDDRIEGIVVVGSMARSPDRWSDVDRTGRPRQASRGTTSSTRALR